MYWIARPLGSPGPSRAFSRRLRSIKRLLAQVSAVLFEQVECDQHHLACAAAAAQRWEVRRAVLVEDPGLAVDQAGRVRHAKRGFYDGREAVGPVVAVLGEAADPLPVPARTKPPFGSQSRMMQKRKAARTAIGRPFA